MTSGSMQQHPNLRPPKPSSMPMEPAMVTKDPRELVRFLHDEIKLSDRELAKAVGGTHEVTIRRWRSKTAKGMPRDTEALDNLRAIVALLLGSGVLYPEEIGRFLRSRNEDLAYRRPLDLLESGDDDEFYRVLKAAELLVERLQELAHYTPE
jgi:hypothetical protein